MSDNIKVTTPAALGREHADAKGYVAGYVVDKCRVICAECYDGDGYHGVIATNDEWDYPGALCRCCERLLDMYLLVYAGHDPKIWYRLHMRDESGVPEDMESAIVRAREKAYSRGVSFGQKVPDEAMDSDTPPEIPNDSAQWANVELPKLRSLSGYVDATDAGTHTDPVLGVADEILSEDVMPAFRNGYWDAVTDENFGPHG